MLPVHTLKQQGTSGSTSSRQLLLRCSTSCIHAVDQARGSLITIRPELVKGFNQSLLYAN